jgi:hypothetical protein
MVNVEVLCIEFYKGFVSLEKLRIWGKARTMQGTCCRTSRATKKKKGVEKFYPDFLLHSPFKNQASQSLGTALDQSQTSPIFGLPLDCYIQRQDVTNCSAASGRLRLKGLQEGINTRTIIRIRYVTRIAQKCLGQVLTLCRICRYC